MERTDAGSLLHFGDVSLSGGELILSVIMAYSENFGQKPDLAKVNLLAFLIEGDGEIESDIMFSNTPYGPKSRYISEFISRNGELVKSRTYGKKPSGARIDPDLRIKLELTDLGRKIASIATNSLSKRDSKILAKILSGWGMEKHSDLLTYICVFYEDFCTSVERKADSK